jgi:hypothetical protein
MWKARWRKWTIDKPAAFGDWLWDVFVLQLAAVLDRLTWRHVIAFIPVLILVLAYCHRIPIPPELMLLGDLLAYIDIFSVLFLLGVLSRAASIVFVIKAAASRAGALVAHLVAKARRSDVRHRREHGSERPKQRHGRRKMPTNHSSRLEWRGPEPLRLAQAG